MVEFGHRLLASLFEDLYVLFKMANRGRCTNATASNKIQSYQIYKQRRSWKWHKTWGLSDSTSFLTASVHKKMYNLF